MAGAELRQNDLEERLARGAAQVQGGIVQAAVQLAQLGPTLKITYGTLT